MNLSPDSLMLYAVVVLALVELAKRIAAIVPGKRDDEIVSVVDGIVRKAIDFLAGKTGKASDPSLVKRD